MNKLLSSGRRGFTLLEILAVVAIMSVLMAMLLSGIKAIKDHARSASALTTVHGIVAAVQHYETDYGRLPDVTAPGQSDSSSGGNDVLVGDEAANITAHPNRLLFWTLRAIPEGPNANDAQNPRKTVYFEKGSVQDPTRPKEGFLDGSRGSDDARGCLFDPWGTQYNVALDANSDQVVDLTAQYVDAIGADAPRVRVGAFSLGADKKLGTNGDRQLGVPPKKADDLVSWR